VFFYQLNLAIDTLNRWMRPVAAGKTPKNAMVQLVMQVLVSITALAIGCYLMVAGKNQASEKTGYSLAGLVIGYWLR
jgi:hypothetical protein